MKNYKQHSQALEKVQRLLDDLGSRFNIERECAEVFDEFGKVSSEMLCTIQELERQIRKTDKNVYKNRTAYQEGYPVVKDFVKVGYLDIDGELVFNDINSELFNIADLFSKAFYIKENDEFISFIPNNLVLEIVKSSSNQELCVVGYIAQDNNKVVYYDQIIS